MKQVVTMISEVEIFHIATVDGDRPRVRPFGFIMEFQDKIYFCTGAKKDFYKQLQKNPRVEVSAVLAGGGWVRLSGKAAFDESPAAKRKAFDMLPDLRDYYQTPDNPEFKVFYLTDPCAMLHAMGQPPKKIL